MTRRRGRPRLGKTGCLFWIFIFLVIIVIILYRGKGSFKNTFSFLKDRPPSEEIQEEERFYEPEETTPEDERIVRQSDEQRDDSAFTAPDQSVKEEAPGEEPATVPAEGKAEGTSREKGRPEIREKVLKAPLYYVRIESDGSAQLQPIIRSVTFTDSPITRTVESLLNGPTASERESGLVSFIPPGTRLLGARIQNGHLTLNFSSTFEDNYNGREAIEFQLSQVMLTSFEFNQVTSLSILINGQNKRYITGEGIPLKEVYTKEDLSRLSTRG
jgi:spore germination protein GerM